MNKKLITMIMALCAVFALTACTNKEKTPEISGNEISYKSTTNEEQVTIQKEAETLFNNLINIGKYKDDKELKKAIEENVYFPAEYLKTLVDSNSYIEQEEFYKINAIHREVDVKKLDTNHYYFYSHTTIEKQLDKSSKPQSAKANVKMEIKKKGDSYKVVRLSISPK